MSHLHRISKSQLRVLQLIARNKATKEIAAELEISVKTVESHRYNIARALEISGNNCVLKYALEHRDELLTINSF
jgi:DNA-binding NarL/FixJ family response regulator